MDAGWTDDRYLGCVPVMPRRGRGRRKLLLGFQIVVSGLMAQAVRGARGFGIDNMGNSCVSAPLPAGRPAPRQAPRKNS